MQRPRKLESNVEHAAYMLGTMIQECFLVDPDSCLYGKTTADAFDDIATAINNLAEAVRDIKS